MEAVSNFLYDVQDVDMTVRRTNSLLRSVNAVRLSIRDIQELIKKPTFASFFWTLIQLFRTYSSIRRLMRLLASETSISAAMFGLGSIQPPEGGEIIPPSDVMADFAPMEVNVQAFRENVPISVEGIDMSMIPEQSMEAVQRVLEEDAELTVEDAKRILASRIIYPERSTGFLESSISWMPQAFGTRIYAGAPYAWWVEEGQRTFTRHHYLRDTTDEARMRLPDKIRAELNKLINKGD